jgi:hypothetical protein
MDDDETTEAEASPRSYLCVPEDEFESWMTPKEAEEEIAKTSVHNGNNLIIQHLVAGLIRSAARKAVIEGDFVNGDDHVDLFEIPSFYWGRRDSDEYLWSAGFVTFKMQGVYSSSDRACTGIRFDRKAVTALADQLLGRKPKTASADGTAISKSGRGGRPRKSFWDPLWADICAQLYVGDLKPEQQQDIENAMLDWAVAHDEELSEQSARDRARLLWAAIQEKERG